MTTVTEVDVSAPEVEVRVGARTGAVLAVASLAGLVLFIWPLLIPVPAGWTHSQDAPMVFAALVPIMVVLVLTQLSDGGMDTRTLALLGVLSAINAALRPALGAGTAGIESVFFLLVLGGRAFGPGFGFILGTTSMAASAMFTAGVGPWLPFQMLAAGWIGLGAGLLPGRARGRATLGQLAMLIVYAIAAAYFYGAIMNMWSWPTITGISTPGYTGPAGGLDYVPGAPWVDNLRRFGAYTLLTSTAGWDTGRAIWTAIALAVLGRPILDVLHRAGRRARLS
ncbi:MAG TPA: ECF transporter S component [Propionibacteriaceae bacterium]